MLDQMLDLFLQNGLRPLSFMSETAELDKEVNRTELTALLVLQFRGQLTMSALAAHLGVPLSTATSLVKRLVRKNLVNRAKSSKDQRIIHVELTGEGMKLALEAKAIMESMFARIRSALSDEELEQFLSLAVKVGKAMQSKGTAGGKETAEPQIRKIAIDD